MEEVRLGTDEVNLVVSIVACGPSALRCGAAQAPGYVIAVNDAFQHVHHDAVLSMDGRWAVNRLTRVAGDRPVYLRRSAFAHCNGLPIPTEALRSVHVFDCDHKSGAFGPHAHTLNGPNSGYCALNLAYVMRPKTVYLFGFDHKGGHFHPESEWRQRGEGCANSPRKFAQWAEFCYQARAQFDKAEIEVVNTNPDSAIRAFKFGGAF